MATFSAVPSIKAMLDAMMVANSTQRPASGEGVEAKAAGLGCIAARRLSPRPIAVRIHFDPLHFRTDAAHDLARPSHRLAALLPVARIAKTNPHQPPPVGRAI